MKRNLLKYVLFYYLIQTVNGKDTKDLVSANVGLEGEDLVSANVGLGGEDLVSANVGLGGKDLVSANVGLGGEDLVSVNVGLGGEDLVSANVDLGGKDLVSANVGLGGEDLVSANVGLGGKDLVSANVDLGGKDLVSANVDLGGEDLVSANVGLGGKDLVSVDVGLGGEDLVSANVGLGGKDLVSANVDLGGKDLVSANVGLGGEDLVSANVGLGGKDLVSANVDLGGKDLVSANVGLGGKDLVSVDVGLGGEDLVSANVGLGGKDLVSANVDLGGKDLVSANVGLGGEDLVSANVDLGGKDLVSVNVGLGGEDLVSANVGLGGEDLVSANVGLGGKDLVSVDVGLGGEDLVSANVGLGGKDLVSANVGLGGKDLVSANVGLGGEDLVSANVGLGGEDLVSVKIDTGRVLGSLLNSYGVQIKAFLGIPYAEPPTGPLRFKPPVPKIPWVGFMNATRQPPLCPQSSKIYRRNQMSEDCLYLNVFVPAKPKDRGLLSVAVYIHGGEFKALSGRTDFQLGPQFLVARDIIVVTVNYRLGPLGFLSLNIDDALGNVGLKDVVLALKWVQNNIKSFGGDPNKVTLGGHNAGSIITQLLTLTPLTNGLFKRAFMNSGSALGLQLSLNPVQIALKLGGILGLNVGVKTDLLQDLLNVDVFDIIDAVDELEAYVTLNGLRPISLFGPTIEIDSPTAILTQSPSEIIKSGIPQNVPILAGFNVQHGLKILPIIRDLPNLINRLDRNLQKLIPSDILYPLYSNESKDLANCIHTFYFGEGKIRDNILFDLVDYITDTDIALGVDTWIRLHKSRAGSAPVYYYQFNFDGDLNWAKIVLNISAPGTAEGDDLGYMFLTRATKSLLANIDLRTKITLRNMLSYWTNFIKYGDPNFKDVRVQWIETGKDLIYLELNDKPKMRSYDNSLISARIEFWQQVYDDYYKYRNQGGFINLDLSIL